MSLMMDDSIDSIVTDPPYGLSFMGKKWDYGVPGVDIWKECLRVLKPGGYLLAFAGTRTQHRMCCNIEDAGFEIRDMIAWVYGSGFPKSHNISKTLDKIVGAERDIVGINQNYHSEDKRSGTGESQHGISDGSFSNPKSASVIAIPATDEAKKGEGWGTALKPALEPITVARKPLSEKTIAANVLKWGTGGINIDGCRVNPTGERLGGGGENRATFAGKEGWGRPWMENEQQSKNHANKIKLNVEKATIQGRFPANLIHDGSDEVLDSFPDSKGQQGDLKNHNKNRKSPNGCFGEMPPANDAIKREDSDKSAARFFYCAKTSKVDREEGLDDLEDKLKLTQMRSANGTGDKNFEGGFTDTVRKNNHPTVKPTKLMRYLVRLVTPPGGTVYDPFAGSGSTGKACKPEGFDFVGSELDENYCEIANQRIK